MDKKVIIIVCAVLFVIIMFPIVINLIYLQGLSNDVYNTMFTASDILTYFGTILAFLGTLGLGYASIKLNQKANDTNKALFDLTKESERKSVMPFLSFNVYLTSYESENVFSQTNIQERTASEDKNKDVVRNKRTDKFIEEINYIISKNSFEAKSELTDIQQNRIQRRFQDTKVNDVCFSQPNDYLYKKFRVENCGLGTAVNLQSTLCLNDNKRYTLPFSVPVSSHFELGLFFDLSEPFEKEFYLSFIYNDVHSNCYRQDVAFTVNKNNNIKINVFDAHIQTKLTMDFRNKNV